MEQKILNLTQHNATFEQKTNGVFEPANKQLVAQMLTFETIPSPEALRDRAQALAELIKKEENFQGDVMIGGAPFFMAPLESALIEIGCNPVYAFSCRESIEEVQGDQVIKKSIFRHIGFVKVK